MCVWVIDVFVDVLVVVIDNVKVLGVINFWVVLGDWYGVLVDVDVFFVFDLIVSNLFYIVVIDVYFD